MDVFKKSIKKQKNDKSNNYAHLFNLFIGKNELKTKTGVVVIRDENSWKKVDVRNINNNYTILELNELYNILNSNHNSYINNKNRLIRIITDFIDSKYRNEGFSN